MYITPPQNKDPKTLFEYSVRRVISLGMMNVPNTHAAWANLIFRYDSNYTRDIYVVSSDEISGLLNSTIYDLFGLFDSLESFYEKIIDRWLFYHDSI